MYFSYDHPKYGKWGAINVIEMFNLPPAVLERIKGEFGVQWNDNNPFSRVSVDHATEWVNGISKSSGGLSSITQTDTATLRFEPSRLRTNIFGHNKTV